MSANKIASHQSAPMHVSSDTFEVACASFQTLELSPARILQNILVAVECRCEHIKNIKTTILTSLGFANRYDAIFLRV
jgi:hypothetical protein